MSGSDSECHPRLLRLPHVLEVVEAELHRLQHAMEACAVPKAAQALSPTSAQPPYETGHVEQHGVSTRAS